MKLIKQKKKGSAILIVMLLITVLATVALTVGYLAMADVNMETNSEDGSMAYYAAEAGIEDGLLRYRYDNNVEVGNVKDPTVTDPTINKIACGAAGTNKDCVERIDMNESTATLAKNNIDLTTNPGSLPNNSTRQYYDLRIQYRSKTVGDFDGSDGTDETYKIEKDQKLELAGDDSLETNLKFKFKMETSDLSENYLLEIRVYDGNGVETNFSKVLDKAACVLAANVSGGIDIKILAKGRTYIKPWGNAINYAMQVESGSTNALKLDSGYTIIESTGYYGSAKRKLQAKIDRKTGKLLEIFDFTLNSLQGGIE